MSIPRKATKVLAASVATVVTGGTVAAAATPAAAVSVGAHITASTTSTKVGGTLTVNGHTTRLPKGDAVRSARVSFGDGSKAVSVRTLKTAASHVYKHAGTYVVTLTVVDKHGKTFTAKKKVTVAKAGSLTASFPIVVASNLPASTKVSTLGLSGTQLSTIASALGVPVGLVPSLPVGFLSLLPTGFLSSFTGGAPTLPGLPGLSSTSLLTSLPVVLPTGLSAATIGALPSSVLSVAQLGALSSVFGVPTSVLSQLPLSALNLLPTSMFALPGAGLPLSLPANLSPTALISSLGLSTSALRSVASLLGVSTTSLPTLPVGVLNLLPKNDLKLPSGASLPALPGLGGLPVVGNLVAMLLAGLPFNLPTGVAGTQTLGTLPLSVLQLSTLSSVFGIPSTVLSSLPVSFLGLLPAGYVN